jgi:hypothetical protein
MRFQPLLLTTRFKGGLWQLQGFLEFPRNPETMGPRRSLAVCANIAEASMTKATVGPNFLPNEN